MAIQKEIPKLCLLIFLLPMFIVACRCKQEINNIVGKGTTSKIVLKETDSYDTFFESEIIRVYDIIDSSLLRKQRDAFTNYDTNYTCRYCNEYNILHKHIKMGSGFCIVKEISSGDFIAIYIDTLNHQLIYHEAAHVIH